MTRTEKVYTPSCQWPITAISYDRVVARVLIQLHAQYCLMALWEGDLSCLKVYKRSLSYAEGSPLTLRNHFIQLYRALDTLFSEYY